MTRTRISNKNQRHLDGMSQSEDPRFIESVEDLTEEKVERLKKVKPAILGIKCGRSACANGLHCFDSGKAHPQFEAGTCQHCGIDLIHWDEVRSRETRNVNAKFEFFEKEWIRHFFFHVPITARIHKYADKHGLAGLGDILESQLRQNKMLRFIPALDWNQTKMLDGTIVHWARHAVACCCRACMNYWHNVPLSQELNDDDIKYFKELGLKFIAKRIPDLTR